MGTNMVDSTQRVGNKLPKATDEMETNAGLVVAGLQVAAAQWAQQAPAEMFGLDLHAHYLEHMK